MADGAGAAARRLPIAAFEMLTVSTRLPSAHSLRAVLPLRDGLALNALLRVCQNDDLLWILLRKQGPDASLQQASGHSARCGDRFARTGSLVRRATITRCGQKFTRVAPWAKPHSMSCSNLESSAITISGFAAMPELLTEEKVPHLWGGATSSQIGRWTRISTGMVSLL